MSRDVSCGVPQYIVKISLVKERASLGRQALNPLSAGNVFSRLNLTSIDV